MKVFIACLGTETNTFVPFPTGRRNFEENGVFHGDATRHTPNLFSAPLHVWRRRAETRGWTVVESLFAFAQPAGVTVRAVYEGYRDEILADLEKALPVDIVLLSMHGAMVADGYDDCEGDLLSRVRALAGPKAIIGGELDLHCHITTAMITQADVLVTFKEYPHIDMAERAEELFTLCADAAEGKTRPVMAVYDCRMVGMYRTPVEPMKSFVARMQALEGKDGVLSVSLGHGFPWGDVAEVGTQSLVVADGDAAKAAAVARQLGQELFAMRDSTLVTYWQPDDAVADAEAAQPGRPVVLADVADNAGGGSPSDSTFVLEALLRRDYKGALIGLLWDPVAFQIAEEAGEGATLDMRIGGKCGRISGQPVDLRVTVKKLAYDCRQSFGPTKNGTGNLAWLQAGGIDIVINTRRTQLFHPDAFAPLGLDPARYRLIVVKSTQHFYAGFAPLASKVHYVTTRGGIEPDFANIHHTKRTVPYWPRVADPFTGQNA
ncbi:M81 family metallopeptidase [Vineibacter terrae]|uniref:M81 family metallopeptidase n=1 Tax=Vineibacter terrae TaxID=2586908 RepID=UPI002E2FAD96|nr:M81 family metallopeptidase [Vineibacter terrae]HEX2891287.1 M81 family metallopeptidase [Vineibacter terrae]